jgi:hypothetical protein
MGGPGMHAAVQHGTAQQQMLAGGTGVMGMSPFMANGTGSYGQEVVFMQGEFTACKYVVGSTTMQNACVEQGTGWLALQAAHWANVVIHVAMCLAGSCRVDMWLGS